jgi:hypothetical protein
MLLWDECRLCECCECDCGCEVECDGVGSGAALVSSLVTVFCKGFVSGRERWVCGVVDDLPRALS